MFRLGGPDPGEYPESECVSVVRRVGPSVGVGVCVEAGRGGASAEGPEQPRTTMRAKGMGAQRGSLGLYKVSTLT